MVSSRLRAFIQTTEVVWPKKQEAGAKEMLLRVAQSGHAKIMAEAIAKHGGPPEFEAYANAPGNTDLASVRLPGPIVYRYRYRRAIIATALDLLRKMSPVVSGAYRDSHTLFIDFVATAGVPPDLAPGQDVMISNTVPYARRLEVGKTESGRAFVVQVPPNIYERAAAALKRQFGAVASIEFTYAKLPASYTIKGRLPSHYIAKGGRRRRRRQIVGDSVLAPAIVIGMKRT